jgi:hypothetical protein
MERDASDEGHNIVGSVERSGSDRASDAGSQSNAEDDFDGGSCTCSYNFGPLSITMRRIREMIE